MTPARNVAFTLDGRSLRAAAGATVAEAMHSHGVWTVSRSVKYHRPRGYTCGVGACGNCPVTVNGLPGVTACTRPIKPGDEVRRELGLPTTTFDLLRTADLLRKWLPAGFQFRLFAKRPVLSRISGRMLAILAGGGRFPTDAAMREATVASVRELTVDVLVIGGGISGMRAALTAAEHPDSPTVAIVDELWEGGRARWRTEAVRDETGRSVPSADVEARLRSALDTSSAVLRIPGIALGLLDGLVPVDGGRVRWEIRPRSTVLATGSYETTLLFPNNDRPGVILADAAVKLAVRTDAPIGRRIVVATDSARGHQVAERLRSLGQNVVAVLDSRPVRDVRADTGTSPAAGFRIEMGSTVLGVAGWSKVRRIRHSSGTVAADVLCLAFARRPAEEFALHANYLEHGSTDLGTDTGSARQDATPVRMPTIVVGSATGHSQLDLDDIVDATHRLLQQGGDDLTRTR